MKLIFFFLLNLSLLASDNFTFPKNAESEVLKRNYITGKFQAKQYLIKVPEYLSNNSKKETYLRKEVLEAYKRLSLAFSKQHPNIKLKILSSFRSYSQQKRIWEWKFQSQKKQKKAEKEIINSILQYSSAPSTSRHHWGTDIDINSLNNSFFEKGNGKIFYDWMKKNAKQFGFCQPYNESKKRNYKGYQLEKWHWSYFPIASKLQQEWKKQYLNKKIDFDNQFSGSKNLQKKVLNYVTSINKNCFSD